MAVAIIVAVLITERRWVGKGHSKDEIGSVFFVGIVAGIVGARVYHLFTGYDWAEGGIAGTVAVWKGGLSIWGALAGGTIGALAMLWYKKLPILDFMDAGAPAVALAQAIGRWGNYFNQELFGRPTTLPWGLRIEPEFRPDGFGQFETFHPTFLYESLWALGIFAFLVCFEKRLHFKPGQTFFAYVSLYTFGRFFFEMLRIDTATKVFGIRWNLLMSGVVFIAGVIMFVYFGKRTQSRPPNPAA